MAPPRIRDVRGFGLVTVVEADTTAAAASLVETAQQHGLLLRLHQTAAMLLPPLTLDDDGVQAICDCFAAVFATPGK
jgi:adenosylmethionine-8-amino-7-oxononanoate aminotransferase